MNFRSFSFVLVSLALLACSKKAPPSVQLFYGACQVDVKSETHGAEIYIDGIRVGEDEVSVKIPCGEKQVTVEKEGFKPYRAYLPVTAQQALKVTVKLERPKHSSDYSLSSELIKQVRAGEALVPPHATPEQKALAIKYADARKAAETASMKTAGGGAAATGGGAAAESWDSVDDWR